MQISQSRELAVYFALFFIWLARCEENLFFSFYAELSENRDMWIGVVAQW